MKNDKSIVKKGPKKKGAVAIINYVNDLQKQLEDKKKSRSI